MVAYRPYQQFTSERCLGKSHIQSFSTVFCKSAPNQPPESKNRVQEEIYALEESPLLVSVQIGPKYFRVQNQIDWSICVRNKDEFVFGLGKRRFASVAALERCGLRLLCEHDSDQSDVMHMVFALN